jgi:hypothetical protein
MKKKNDKLKILLSKWYFNYYELEEQKELYNEYNIKFNEKINTENNETVKLSDSKEIDILKNENENKNENIPDSNDKPNNEDDGLEENEREYLKKIIKKMKLECHPDKTKDKERHELIKEINDAEKNNDYSFILLCANELNIKELYTDIAIIENFFKKFYKIKVQKEEEIKNSCAWAWGTADSEDKKKKVEEFVKSKNKK